MTTANRHTPTHEAPPSRLPALLLGVGLGGFVDGIVLHQILQWHHLVSDVAAYPTTTVAGLETNTLVDGAFHLAMWFFVLAGSLLTVHAWRRRRLPPSWSFHLGLVVMGWGLFNVVEGAVNHQLLGIHHVRDDLGAPLSWDLGFLVVSVLLVVGGWLIHRRDPTSVTERATARSDGRRTAAEHSGHRH